MKRENARLRLQAARLGSTERIKRAAADLGLVLPAPGQVRYLEARPAEDAALALKRMTAPDPVAVALPAPAAPVAPTTATDPAAAPVEPAPTAPPPTASPVAATAPGAAPAPAASGTPPATPGATD